MNAVDARTRCRTLVAGFGRPGMRDLDFGRQLIRYLEGLSWNEGVVVEDLSYAAPLVLDRLKELEPAKVVLVGAVARGFEAPGSLRRHRLNAAAPPQPDEVQRSLAESVQGVVDIDHTLAIARHYGALPAETVLIEVEPADCSFGLGFSEQLARSFDAIVALVREELGCAGEAPVHTDLDPAVASVPLATAAMTPADVDKAEPSAELAALVRFAGQYRETRMLEPHRGRPRVDKSLHDGLAIAGRTRPWGLDVGGGGDWFDVVPLDRGWYGCVIGDVGARGVAATAAMADLRAAVRAYAVSDGRSPRRVLVRLDRLVAATGVGAGATLIYVAIDPASGETRLANAGQCPPLLVTGDGEAEFLGMARGGPLGTSAARDRREARLVLTAGATLALFTAGLVQRSTRSTVDGLERLRSTAAQRFAELDDLCRRVFEVCAPEVGREDDMALLVLRRESSDEPVPLA